MRSGFLAAAVVQLVVKAMAVSVSWTVFEVGRVCHCLADTGMARHTPMSGCAKKWPYKVVSALKFSLYGHYLRNHTCACMADMIIIIIRITIIIIKSLYRARSVDALRAQQGWSVLGLAWATTGSPCWDMKGEGCCRYREPLARDSRREHSVDLFIKLIQCSITQI